MERAPIGLFSAYPHIQDLELDMCRIKKIEDDTFVGSRRLMKLNLAGNEISELTNTTFSWLHYLLVLNLGWCHIDHLPNGVFDGLTTLKKLFLNSNNLQNLNENIFHKLKQLTDLDLANTQLTVLSANLFSQNVEINCLVLGLNRLTEVEDSIQNLTKLNQLVLSNNHLTKFENYPDSVTDLFINDNRLTKLFINKNVELLEASNNQISHISASFDHKQAKLCLKGNKLLSNEQPITLGAYPFNQISGLELVPSCRKLVLENASRNLNDTYESLPEYKTCVQEMLQVINCEFPEYPLYRWRKADMDSTNELVNKIIFW